MHNLIKDERQFFPNPDAIDIRLSLHEILEYSFLMSPDSKEELFMHPQSNHLTDGDSKFEIISCNPLLYPKEVTDAWLNKKIPLIYHQKPLIQYYLLSQIKQPGEIIAPLNNPASQKHQYRLKKFCSELSGLVLDIGCDRSSISMQLFSPVCKYIGLDPYSGSVDFQITGIAEMLPIKDSTMDVVLFNTSLDHILDYHTAIKEACRVLKKNGCILIASYVWIEQATLLYDEVHFHHFRDYELIGAVKECFTIEDICRYEDPKNDQHRYGFYIKAIKNV